jgi:mRNA interferase RelE/StbE
MKLDRYSQDALVDLRKYRSEAKRIMAKIERYAETGAGDVTQLAGVAALRLRVGDFRVISAETATAIDVLRIGPRGGIYE